MEEAILEHPWANFFGFERVDDKGKTHCQPWVIRGNGTLRLTSKGVYFSRYVPQLEIFIPLQDILKVELGRWHNGKTYLFLPILKIRFKKEGEVQIFGACVGWKKKTLVWKEKLEEMLKKDFEK
ncbi:MAG: hypothetical protein QMD05_04245 [Candidatus Brocadiaceae bacterium]|nr:hypothetical protein [Candidatus Brocadiaceae bacterium]